MSQDLAPIPELYVSYESAQKMKLEAADLVSHDLSPRQICDLELLMNGGFSPLSGFLGKADFDSVCSKMRLADGTLWPLALYPQAHRVPSERIATVWFPPVSTAVQSVLPLASCTGIGLSIVELLPS